MGSIFLSVLMNGLLVALLVATILYCLRLNKKIADLQEGKSELAEVIRAFDESTTRATQNINAIHKATDRIAENIQLKIDKANYVANDLELLIARAAKLTGKPAEAAPAPRPGAAAAAEPVAPRAAESPSGEEAASRRPLRGRSRIEQELMNMLGGRKSGA